MPLYDYRCRACGAAFERFIKYHSETDVNCPHCESAYVERTVSTSNFQLGGSCWERDGYSRNN